MALNSPCIECRYFHSNCFIRSLKGYVGYLGYLWWKTDSPTIAIVCFSSGFYNLDLWCAEWSITIAITRDQVLHIPQMEIKRRDLTFHVSESCTKLSEKIRNGKWDIVFFLSLFFYIRCTSMQKCTNNLCEHKGLISDCFLCFWVWLYITLYYKV